MLRVITNSHSFRRTVTRTVTRPLTLRLSSTDSHSHKIQALPFKLPEDKVSQIVNIASYVNQHAFLSIFKIIKSIFSQKMPDVKESVSSMQVRKAYVPFWYYDMAVSADVTPSTTDPTEPAEKLLKAMGPPRQMLGIGFDCFWPGHTWDPMCYLSFGKSAATRMETLVPFTPELYEGNDIEVLPFTVNPFTDLADRAPQALENLQVNSLTHRKGVYTLNNAEVLFSSAYPIYWPVYVAQFTDENHKEGEPPKTVVIGAHSTDPPIYQWESKKPGVDQWINNGPWVKLDVTEPEWQMGFGNQPPLKQLVHRYLTQVIGEFQTNEIDWEDDRIQSYTGYEAQNKDYLKQLFKVWAERSMLSRIETMDGNEKTIGLGSKEGNNPRLQVRKVSEVREEIEGKIGKELEKLEQVEPVWFKEYQKKSPSS
ncbi:hypothetical protein HPULCUR_000784 [Helicostylum pulchrum]|uniref:Uncharacterized protein n=1 Tax=Helicostylum pulchrum TaxID=562976 RepID=A0ABP9XMZ1_9FUNG